MRISPRSIYILLVSSVGLWCTLIVLTPVLASANNPAAAMLYRFFAPICHQDAARSFTLCGSQCAVCIRCSAIYFGFLAGVLLTPFLPRRRSRSVLPFWCIALAPMLIDVIADVIGVHPATVTTRTVTGLVFGLLSAYALLPDLIEAISGLIPSSSHDARSSHE